MIAEMMAEHIADEMTELTAVRPVSAGLHPTFPHVVYETVDMRNKRYLNCASNQYEGTIRYFAVGATYEQCSAAAERLKDVLLPYKETGENYRIRRCDLSDEGDIAQDEKDKKVFFAKSLDFDVKALKITA